MVIWMVMIDGGEQGISNIPIFYFDVTDNLLVPRLQMLLVIILF